MEKQTIDDVETKLEALFAESPGKSKTPSTDENVEQKTPEKQNPKIEKEPQTKPAVKKRRRKAKQKSQIKKKFAQQDQEKAQITNKFKKQQHQKPPEDSYKGPFIQFKKDGFFTVVNSSTAVDEDSEKQGSSKSKKQIYDKTKIRSFNVSTLSHKYDADKTDKTWVCVYCKNGPHKQNLGDLFGPYVVTTNNDEYKFHLMSPTRTNKENVDFSGMKKISDTDYEVWTHEDCAVWSPGVFIISAHLVGLEDSVWSSVRHKCIYCQEFGAMICCLDRGCKNTMAHFPCARNNNWNLNENEFKTFCEKHEK